LYVGWVTVNVEFAPITSALVTSLYPVTKLVVYLFKVTSVTIAVSLI